MRKYFPSMYTLPSELEVLPVSRFQDNFQLIKYRLVLLDKLRLQTRAKEEEESLARGGKDPFIVVKNPSASKGGVAETSIKVSTAMFCNSV